MKVLYTSHCCESCSRLFPPTLACVWNIDLYPDYNSSIHRSVLKLPTFSLQTTQHSMLNIGKNKYDREGKQYSSRTTRKITAQVCLDLTYLYRKDDREIDSNPHVLPFYPPIPPSGACWVHTPIILHSLAFSNPSIRIMCHVYRFWQLKTSSCLSTYPGLLSSRFSIRM